MIKDLYHKDSGYINMGAVLTAPYPYIVVTSARGTGKTYGALEHVIVNKVRFLYLRRTDRILQFVCDPLYNPFKRINTDHGWNITSRYKQGFGVFTDEDSEQMVGYAAALSTFANIRGFDGSDIDLVIFDEFIPEPQERVGFDTFRALVNALETIGRNRELEGRSPLKLIMLSNSDLIYSDIIAGFGIGDMLRKMQNDSIEQMEASPDMLLIRPLAENFREKKKETALYRVTKDSEFAKVALLNQFPFEDEARIGALPLREYKVVAAVSGQFCIYKHKRQQRYYITKHLSGDPPRYDASEADVRRFKREQGAVLRAFLKRKVYFEGVNVQTAFKKYLT